MTVDELLAALKLKFKRRELADQALTHRSYVNEHESENASDNERLEFLGDAVLDFVAGELLFLRYPDMPEGDMTRLRAALVRTESLATIAGDLGIDRALRMGKGEELSGGRKRATNLCGAFEAFIGALYLDQGMEHVREFAVPLLETRLHAVFDEQSDKDARSLLQEWSQAQHNLTPMYHMVGAIGPDHDKQFTVEVTIGGKIAGRGVGRSKQIASQEAARNAFDNLRAGRVTIG